jgi:hypothetical protein
MMKTLIDAVAHAVRYHDGHLTIMRFTGNWRVAFGTPAPCDIEEWRDEIEEMAQGETLDEAITSALKDDEERRKGTRGIAIMSRLDWPRSVETYEYGRTGTEEA